jgi:hypothetical protein
VGSDGGLKFSAESAVVSELSDSFDGAVDNAVEATVKAVECGISKLRVDFDTTLGDQTYTSLKNVLPFVERYVSGVADALAPPPRPPGIAGGDGEAAAAPEERRTVAVYFPDTGAAAGARFEWQVDTDEPLVPRAVRFCAFPRDEPEESDCAIICVCPKASECVEVEALIGKMQAERGEEE